MRFLFVRVFAVVLSFAMVVPGFGAEPPESTLPPAAAGILSQMDREVVAAKTKAVVALDKVLKDTTKKGDLAGAVAVKEVIDQLKADTQAAAGRKTRVGRAGAREIVGRWTDSHNNVDILADGTCSSIGLKGRWQMDGNVVEILWDHKHSYRLNVTPEGLVGTHLGKSGEELEPIRLTRGP
jgi:hypothetical protein